MRCFACDMVLSGTTSPDHQTGRYYCNLCLEPLNEVILSLDRKQFLESLGDMFKDDLADAIEEVELESDDVPLETLEPSEDDDYNNEHDPNY